MRRFVANLNDNSYVNVVADRMQIEDGVLYVHCGNELVALIEVSCILVARLDEVQG